MKKITDLLAQKIFEIPRPERPDRLAFGNETHAFIKKAATPDSYIDVPRLSILGISYEIDASIPPGEFHFKQFVRENGELKLKTMRIVKVELEALTAGAARPN
jgi:hypothetical protein